MPKTLPKTVHLIFFLFEIKASFPERNLCASRAFTYNFFHCLLLINDTILLFEINRTSEQENNANTKRRDYARTVFQSKDMTVPKMCVES